MKTLTKKEQLEKAFRSIIQSFGINDGLDNLVSQLIRERSKNEDDKKE